MTPLLFSMDTMMGRGVNHVTFNLDLGMMIFSSLVLQVSVSAVVVVGVVGEMEVVFRCDDELGCE
jgi:hypothetical protein